MNLRILNKDGSLKSSNKLSKYGNYYLDGQLGKGPINKIVFNKEIIYEHEVIQLEIYIAYSYSRSCTYNSPNLVNVVDTINGSLMYKVLNSSLSTSFAARASAATLSNSVESDISISSGSIGAAQALSFGARKSYTASCNIYPALKWFGSYIFSDAGSTVAEDNIPVHVNFSRLNGDKGENLTFIATVPASSSDSKVSSLGDNAATGLAQCLNTSGYNQSGSAVWNYN